MIELALLQRQFQDCVLGTSDAIVQAVDAGPRANPVPRLTIYQDAYRIRLIDALANDFDALARVMGRDAFVEACGRYVRTTPSTFRNIRWYGGAFARFLRTTLPYKREPWLAEVASFEWTLALAFDAADASCVTFEDFAPLTPDAWERIAFAFHPSVHRLALSTNAPAIRKAVDADGALPMPAALADPVEWIVWRQDFDARFRSLHPVEAWAIDAAMRGASFPSICEGVCERLEPEQASAQAALWLRDWVEAGLIAGIVVGPPGVEPGTNGL